MLKNPQHSRLDNPMRNYNLDTADGSNAFIFGLIFNHGQSAKKSWSAPFQLFNRADTHNVKHFANMELGLLSEIMAKKPSLHRFPRTIAKQIIRASQYIVTCYCSDSRQIWQSNLPLSKLMARLMEIPGIGEHKAMIGIFMLTVEFNINVVDDGTEFSILNRCPGLYRQYYDMS